MRIIAGITRDNFHRGTTIILFVVNYLVKCVVFLCCIYILTQCSRQNSCRRNISGSLPMRRMDTSRETPIALRDRWIYLIALRRVDKKSRMVTSQNTWMLQGVENSLACVFIQTKYYPKEARKRAEITKCIRLLLWLRLLCRQTYI